MTSRRKSDEKAHLQAMQITLDLGTIEKCQELASEKGQSVSAMLRFLVAAAFEQAMEAKRGGRPWIVRVLVVRFFEGRTEPPILRFATSNYARAVRYRVGPRTIPDFLAASRMLGLEAATEAEVRKALGEGFPKHPLHKIVCIGALVASRQPEGWLVDALGAPHTGERPEAELIKAFAERVDQLRPQMITWNGHSFDLPVLRVCPDTLGRITKFSKHEPN
jgi:hypothetical protein